MSTKHQILIATAVLLMACNGKKSQPSQSAQLIEDIEHFAIDTVQAAPGDTLCSYEVDEILRRYPELYHATQKAKDAYTRWVAQEQNMQSAPNAIELMDISHMLDETLLGTADETADTWPDLSAADSLYLQLLASEPNTSRKSDIGRTRRAWLNYTEQLQRLTQALPEECHPRFMASVARRANQYLGRLQQQTTKPQGD